MSHPNLWHLNRDSVARGVAVGLFAAFIPLPAQMLIAAILAITIFGNVPIAIAATWISNPVTFFPIIYLIYYVGAAIIDKPVPNVAYHALTLDFKSRGALFGSITHWFGQFSEAFIVGLPVVAITTAVVGYWIVIIFYNIRDMVRNYRLKKKKKLKTGK